MCHARLPVESVIPSEAGFVSLAKGYVLLPYLRSAVAHKRLGGLGGAALQPREPLVEASTSGCFYRLESKARRRSEPRSPASDASDLLVGSGKTCSRGGGVFTLLNIQTRRRRQEAQLSFCSRC